MCHVQVSTKALYANVSSIITTNINFNVFACDSWLQEYTIFEFQTPKIWKSIQVALELSSLNKNLISNICQIFTTFYKNIRRVEYDIKLFTTSNTISSITKRWKSKRGNSHIECLWPYFINMLHFKVPFLPCHQIQILYINASNSNVGIPFLLIKTFHLLKNLSSKYKANIYSPFSH